MEMGSQPHAPGALSHTERPQYPLPVLVWIQQRKSSGIKHSHTGDENFKCKKSLSSLVYFLLLPPEDTNWATLFLGDINMGTWPSRLGESQMRQ
jgi:hypothetical protein